MNNLRRADGGKVPVPLIGEHRLGGMGALDARGHGRGTAVGGLQHVTVEVLKGKDGAPHGTYADGLVQKSQLYQRLGDELVNNAVVAAGAVVQLGVRQALGFFIYNRHITAPPSKSGGPLQ